MKCLPVVILTLFALGCDSGKNDTASPDGDTDTDTDADTDVDTGPTDADGDGWTVADGDCDDADPSVYPDSGEVDRDLADDDCDGLVDEDFLAAGDVVVSEVMVAPLAGDPTGGEWFEMWNRSDGAVDVVGWTVSSHDAESFAIGASLVIPPGEHRVVGASADAVASGGAGVAWAWPTGAFSLLDDTDSVLLDCGDVRMSEVGWDDYTGPPAGASYSLDPRCPDLDSKSTSGCWCASVTPFGAGDLGTPGMANDACTDHDWDGDGYSLYDGDCDDTDPAVNPGAEEICNDGVDNNCDGSATPCGLSGTVDLSAADAKLFGEARGDHAGGSVAAGDVDGDGVNDVLVGAYAEGTPLHMEGAAYIVLGPVAGPVDLASASAKLTGEDPESYAGISVAVGDVDGDGVEDVLVGSFWVAKADYSAGAVYLVYGPVSGTMDLSGADAKLAGEDAQDCASQSLTTGDVDGDGQADIIVGAYKEDEGGFNAGATYLVREPASGMTSLSLADAKLIGEREDDYAGYSVAAGDVDGDGLEDALVGAPQEDVGGDGAGAAYLVLGPVTGTVDLSSADAKFVGETTADRAGISIGAGDVDGDGIVDVIVGAPWEDTGGEYAGAAYLVLGPVAGAMDLSIAAAKIMGERPGDLAGNKVAARDVDGDGADDVLVSAGGEDTGGQSAGAVYLVLGPRTGSVNLSLADAKFVGEAAADGAGWSIAAEDVNDDGMGDILVGATYASTDGLQSGAAYVLYGGGL